MPKHLLHCSIFLQWNSTTSVSRGLKTMAPVTVSVLRVLFYSCNIDLFKYGVIVISENSCLQCQFKSHFPIQIPPTTLVPVPLSIQFYDSPSDFVTHFSNRPNTVHRQHGCPRSNTNYCLSPQNVRRPVRTAIVVAISPR